VTLFLFQINGVAFDWTTGNIYWVDAQYKMIAVLATDENSMLWKAVVSDLNSPKDIAVDPLR